MLIRIVKMTFKPEEVDSFIEMFDENKNDIRNSEGCSRLELIRDMNDPEVIMTYSFWTDESYLEKYKNSEVFKKVWPQTKRRFAAKPEAWSLERLELLP